MFEAVLLSLAILAGDEPMSLVKALFHAELEAAGGGAFGDEGLARFYTEDLVDDFEALLDLAIQRNEQLLGGDPIIGHPEFCSPLRDLEVVEGIVTQTTAVVTARFMSQWCFTEATIEAQREVTEIVFHLVEDDGEWRIADFDHSLYGSYRAAVAALLAP